MKGACGPSKQDSGHVTNLEKFKRKTAFAWYSLLIAWAIVGQGFKKNMHSASPDTYLSKENILWGLVNILTASKN